MSNSPSDEHYEAVYQFFLYSQKISFQPADIASSVGLSEVAVANALWMLQYDGIVVYLNEGFSLRSKLRKEKKKND